MKIIKILIKGLGLVLVLVLAVIGIFIATFDANQYKQDLSDLVKQQTGRALEFTGDIGLTLYPKLGMKLGSMSFENAKGFGSEPMLAVKHVSVSVDVMSLFALNPQIAQLKLDGLTLNLRNNKQGITNWDDLIKPEPQSSATESNASTSPETLSTAADMDIVGSFGGLNITNANLSWVDDVTAAAYQVQLQSLTTGIIQPAQSFPLQLKMSLNSGQELAAQIDLQTQLLVDRKTIKMTGMKLQTTAQGRLLPVSSAKLDLMADMNFALETNQLSLKGFNTRASSAGGVLKKTSTNLSGEIGFDLDRQLLTIGVLDVQVQLDDPSLPKEHIEIALSSSQFELQLNQRSLSLEDLVLKLNENEFKGQVKVLDYAKPSAQFKLATRKFDVDALLGFEKSSDITVPEADPSKPEEPAKDVQIELPMEMLRSLELDGELSVAQLIAQGLTVNNLLLKVNAAKGVIDIAPLKLDLYQGSLAGSVQVNAQADQPSYKLVQKLSSFQIGEFLKDFSGDDLVSGAANVDINLTTQGDWLSKIKSNLNGNLAIALKDGALKGFNLRHKIDTAKAKLKREQLPALNQQKTDFSALSLSGVVKQGVFSSQDLDMQAPLIRVGGKGSANLVEETVDYLVNAKLVATSKGQQSGTADDLKGVAIPVSITGPWLSPKIDVQYDELLKARLDEQKAKLKEKLDAEKAKAQAQLDAQKEKIRADLEQKKAALQQQLAAEKQKLELAKEKELAAQKAQLAEQRKLSEAKQKAELEAKKQAEKERAEQKLKDKLKKLF